MACLDHRFRPPASLRRSALRRLLRWTPCVVAACLAGSCLGPQSERLHCDQLLPNEQASFQSVRELFQPAGPGTGCTAGNCHGRELAQGGFRFDTRAVLLEALSNRLDSVYAQVASGQMPPPEETEVLGIEAWTATDLSVLRTWYCNGGFADE